MSGAGSDVAGVLGLPLPTARAGVIGDPVAHSLSPFIHRAAYRALGLDWEYEAFLVKESDTLTAIDEAATLGFRGLSVTTPLKVAASLACDERSDAVGRIGAANTVVFSDRTRRAENTDGDGLLNDLAEAVGFVPEGAVCGVIGAGATARSVIAALSDRGAKEVLVVNRTEKRAKEAALLAGERGRAVGAEALDQAALVVQAAVLSSSDGANTGIASVLARFCREGQLVVDVTYEPRMSAFLSEASARGARVRNGLGMLVHQAALQVSLFTGCDAPLAVMWEAVKGR